MKGALLLVFAETRQSGYSCAEWGVDEFALMPGECRVVTEYASWSHGSAWAIIGNKPGVGFHWVASGATWDGENPEEQTHRLKRLGYRLV